MFTSMLAQAQLDDRSRYLQPVSDVAESSVTGRRPSVRLRKSVRGFQRGNDVECSQPAARSVDRRLRLHGAQRSSPRSPPQVSVKRQREPLPSKGYRVSPPGNQKEFEAPVGREADAVPLTINLDATIIASEEREFLFTWRTAERMVPGERGYQPPGAFCLEVRSRVRRSTGKTALVRRPPRRRRSERGMNGGAPECCPTSPCAGSGMQPASLRQQQLLIILDRQNGQ